MILAGVEPAVLDRLLAWLRYRVPEARVCGVLYITDAPKPLGRRVRALVRRVRDNPRHLGYVGRRIVATLRGPLRWTRRALLHLVHAYRPPGHLKFGVAQLEESCRRHGGAWYRTTDPHTDAAIEFVRARNPDLGLVFGTPILKSKLFALPRLGSANLHQRKLPDYRGGGPVGLWEMLDGQTEIGVTVHRVLAQLDAGPVLRSRTIPIEPYDTLESLALKAHVVGIDLLAAVVADHVRGEVREVPQTGPSRMFRSPKPLDLRRHEQQLATLRPAYHPARGRPTWKLLVRSVLLGSAGLVRNWRRRLTGTFPMVVLFHHVITDRPHFLGIPTAQFLKHLEFLHANYRVVDLETGRRELATGCVREPLVVLTFDDGYADNHLSLLAASLVTDIPAMLFLCSQRIEDAQPFDHDLKAGYPGFPPLTWDQVQDLEQVGFRSGSHTRTHFDCGVTDPGRLEDEIVGSRADIESRLGHEVHHFSFPIGLQANISAPALALARCHYRVVCSAYGGMQAPGRPDEAWHVFRESHPPDVWELELLLQGMLEVRQPSLWTGGSDQAEHGTIMSNPCSH